MDPSMQSKTQSQTKINCDLIYIKRKKKGRGKIHSVKSESSGYPWEEVVITRVELFVLRGT